jgi:LmbE family N-acetylglucosaminyl deacetylase
MRTLFFFITGCFFSSVLFAQTPKDYSSSQIFEQIKKLEVLGSVLYIAAHPDDENTKLLAYLSNEKLYRTGYLSMTRGDGGQNLIGDNQGPELGLIRTQELLSARRIDGAEQFFTTAFDFGYSKNPKETFKIWNEKKILADVVWLIRKFQPDVIITRFPTTGEGGHGHHTASAILAGEAFSAAADPTQFPEQFQYGVKPWQVKRLLWNTFNFGSVNTTNPNQFKIDVGGYNSLLGKSYGEIAAESRSQHKSQGFGVPSSRGSQYEYFKLIKGDPITIDLMDGITTNWNRINLPHVEKSIQLLKANYSLAHPELSLPALLDVYQLIKQSGEGYWQNQKLSEIQQIIKECVGLYLEATAPSIFVTQGDSLQVRLLLNKRLPGNVSIVSAKLRNQNFSIDTNLPTNENQLKVLTVLVPDTAAISQPYWLVNPMTTGSFTVNNQLLIGQPSNNPESIEITLKFNEQLISYSIPIQFKSNDPVKGEEYQPIFIIPKMEVEPSSEIVLSINNKPTPINVTTISHASTISLDALKHNTNNDLIESKQGFYFKNFTESKSSTIHWYTQENKNIFDSYKVLIQYPHIPNIIYFKKADTKLVGIDLSITGKKVGYIAGAGDKIPEALEKMGYEVSLLSAADITKSNLAQYDAIVTGVRAYNIHEWLNEVYDVLMDYVNGGGVLLVQYNTNNNIGPIKAKIGPYPFNISRNRVTDENAPVSFLDPKNSLLNYPNQITQNDFENWIQERSTYEAVDVDNHYQSLFQMHDEGEPDQTGSLIYTNYGKGRFIYSGLVFFRELPAGIPGAYRLFANLLAKPKTP